eukprot:g10378.t1
MYAWCLPREIFCSPAWMKYTDGKQAAVFHEQGAVEALLEMLGMFKLDEVFLRQAVRTLIPLCGQDDVILDHFLDLGGRVALDETLEMHKDDPHMYCPTCRPLVDCPDFLGPAGNRLSADPAQRCLRPGPGKRLVYPGTSGSRGAAEGDDEEEMMDPVTDDLVRIQRLLEHVEKFPKILDVVEPCVDALIAVGKSAATEAVLESKCVFNLLKAMKTFPKTRSLQWKVGEAGSVAAHNQHTLPKTSGEQQLSRRSVPSVFDKGLLAIIHLAKKDAVCFDLGKAGAVQLLVKMWAEWEDDEMRQLLLWAMNEIARIETNQRRMSAERVGAMLRETMEPAPARLAVTGAMVTMEEAGHYCVPVKLKRLYRERKLGSPFAKGDEDREKSSSKVALGVPMAKALFGKVGDDWKDGEAGLV